MAKRRDPGGTLSATIIVDPPDIGGEVRMIVEGRTFVLRGGVVQGLRKVCADRAHDAAFWSK